MDVIHLNSMMYHFVIKNILSGDGVLSKIFYIILVLILPLVIIGNMDLFVYFFKRHWICIPINLNQSVIFLVTVLTAYKL